MIDALIARQQYAYRAIFISLIMNSINNYQMEQEASKGLLKKQDPLNLTMARIVNN